MDSPFAPPELPVEPPYTPQPSPVYAPTVPWPVQPTTVVPTSIVPSSIVPSSIVPSSIVMGTAVLPGRQRPKHLALWIGIVACLASAGVAYAIVHATDSTGATAATTAPTVATTIAPLVPASATLDPGAQSPAGNTSAGLDVTGIVNKVRGSVVKVAVDITSGPLGAGEGVGTGVILTSDGEILTNAHVVADADKVRVLLDGTSEPIDAKVLGVDAGNDLALIKVDKTSLPVMTLGNSDDLQVGQPVVAMGYALDLEGDVSVTSGIISALNRSMVTEAGALDGLLQTDSAISSGNSGGPLVTAAGEMIGINTAVARSDTQNTATNIAFAISTKEIEKIIDRLKTSGSTDTRVQGYLGIGVEDRHDGGRGAIVSDVQSGSPADKLGLKVGDVVTHVDGAEINGQAGLIAAIRDSAPGDKVKIDYSRNGDAKSGTATLDARPPGG